MIESLEYFLLILIAVLQVAIFASTKLKIAAFQAAIPPVESFSIDRAFDSSNGLGEPVVECREGNPTIGSIVGSINIYLNRNKNSVSDFYLIKDITERNMDALEEDINLTISVPLYLGLMGTMLGVIFGLFSMPDISSTSISALTEAERQLADQKLASGINALLAGVRIAMGASFLGLALTVINSGLYFKKAKALADSKKNEFYTFIQTELLPVVNQSLGATFEGLQRNLGKFNDEFSSNLQKLSTIFSSNQEALKSQEKILTSLENIDIANVAKYNVKVLKELQTTTQEFEKFNVYVANVNAMVSGSKALADKIDEMILRTAAFKGIAERINTSVADNQSLMAFLTAHVKELESYKGLVQGSIKQSEVNVRNTVAEVAHSMSDIVRELKEYVGNASKELSEFTVQEIEVLRQTLSENKTNLDNLQFLEVISKSLDQFKTSTASQTERVKQGIEEIHKGIDRSSAILGDLREISRKRRSIGDYLKPSTWFRKNGSK